MTATGKPAKPNLERLENERPEASEWRVFGSNAQMVDMQEHGDLSPATDDNGVNTCVKRAHPPAPGFEGDRAGPCESGELSGAYDGAAASKRSAARRKQNAQNAQDTKKG